MNFFSFSSSLIYLSIYFWIEWKKEFKNPVEIADIIGVLVGQEHNSNDFINGDILDRNIDITLKQMKKRYNILE